MKELIIWAIMLIVIYCFYELFVIGKKKALENMKTGKELTLLKRKYKLDYDKLNLKKVVRLVGLANAFILATVVMICFFLRNFISNIVLWMLAISGVCFLLLIPMILICYSQIGKYLLKKQGGK
jgi:hypothetical protein